MSRAKIDGVNLSITNERHKRNPKGTPIFRGRLDKPRFEKLSQEASRRGRVPADVLADLLRVVIDDNLFDAILGVPQKPVDEPVAESPAGPGEKEKNERQQR